MDGNTLCAFDLQGYALWVADAGGFYDPETRPAGESKRGAALTARKSAPLVRAGAELLLADLQSSDRSGLSVLDAGARTVRMLDISNRVRPPFALPELPGHGRCVVGAGPERRISDTDWESTLVAVRLDGTAVWEHAMNVRPQGVIADAGGTVVTWSTPTQERWSKYRKWFDLSTECVVRGVSSSGEHLWTWHPPGPLTANPVISASGQLYVAADDRLWALG